MRVAIPRIISLVRSVVLLGFLTASCSPTFNFEGRWVGNRGIKPPEGVSDVVAYTVGKVDLKISGGRFELLEGGVPKSGRVRYASGKALLTTEEVWDKPIETLGPMAVERNEEIEITPTTNDLVLFKDPGGFDPNPIELKRDPKP